MSRFYLQISWNDVPHLTKEAKAELLASIPPFQREAREKGIPQLGAGAIYPVQIETITVPDFTIPPAWRCAYGLDVGWNWTATVFGAWDEQSDIIYIWRAYKAGQAEPVVHTEAIRGPRVDGEPKWGWIPGVCDPAANASNQLDGQKLFEVYRGLGLNIDKAANAVSAGLLEVWNRLSSGRMKVFASLSPWFSEFAMYHRDERGNIVKVNDHLMDATRYLVMSGGRRAIVRPDPVKKPEDEYQYVVGPGGFPGGQHRWLGN